MTGTITLYIDDKIVRKWCYGSLKERKNIMSIWTEMSKGQNAYVAIRPDVKDEVETETVKNKL